MENNIQRLYDLIKKFETDNNSKTTAVLFDNDYLKGWRRLMVSSECLDDLSPYDSILELVKYIKENDPTIHQDLLFNISTVHTGDESIHKVRESFDEGVRYFNEMELFYDTITNVYLMI